LPCVPAKNAVISGRCDTTHYNTLQHAATHCGTLRHTATHCKTLQLTAAHYTTLALSFPVFPQKMRIFPGDSVQHTATHCNTLQHTATHRNTLCVCLVASFPVLLRKMHRYNTLQHTATNCNKLQHTSTRVRQHTATNMGHISYLNKKTIICSKRWSRFCVLQCVVHFVLCVAVCVIFSSELMFEDLYQSHKNSNTIIRNDRQMVAFLCVAVCRTFV